MSDLRLALRSLLRDRGFTVVVILTLALGIGANTAVFSVVDAIVLHPLPFADPDRLVALYATSARDNRNGISYPNFLDLRSARTFETLAIWKPAFFALDENGRGVQLAGQRVSASYFQALRVAPLLGRTFSANEDMRGGPAVAVLGEGIWRQRYAADRGVIGRTLTLDGRVHTIIGVVPAYLRILSNEVSATNDVFVPIGQYDDPVFLGRGSASDTTVVGRLTPSATLEAGRAEMAALARNLEGAYPAINAGIGINLVPLSETLTGSLRPAVIALFGAVACVLLIACANVANLFLVRSMNRAREFAVRLALGASGRHILRLLLVESLLLAGVGGVLGIWIASSGTQAALRILPDTLPPISTVSINSMVIAFTLAISLLAAIAIGLAPGLVVTRQAAQHNLKQTSAGAISRHRAQRGFVVAEIALTLVLLVGAGLMIQSLSRLWSVNPGFSPEQVLTLLTNLSPDQSKSPATIRASYRAIDERLSSVGGVTAASIVVGAIPFTGSTTVMFQRDDEPAPATSAQRRIANFYAVGPDYFETMRIRVARGRTFARLDDMTHPYVAMVDDQLAGQVFPNQNPIGRRIRFGGFPDAIEIVGIVAHVKHGGLDVNEDLNGRAQLYIPFAQLPDFIAPAMVNGVLAVVRSNLSPAALMPSINETIATLDPRTVVHSERPMDYYIARSLSARRFSLSLLTAFAGIALLLSTIGIYGVVSFATSRRTREMGLRAALGATPTDVIRLVVGEGQKMAVAGVATGLLGALLADRLLSTLLYGVSPTDPLTLTVVGLLMLVIAFMACLIPARRALRIDPAAALRAE